MDSTLLRVPDALLLDRHLGNSAKLLWIVLQQVSGGATLPATWLLQARSGLARHTVLRALAELRARGWLPQGPDPGCAAGQAGAAAAHIPEDLLPDRRVSVEAKLLYAILQRIAGCHHPQGECTPARRPGGWQRNGRGWQQPVHERPGSRRHADPAWAGR